MSARNLLVVLCACLLVIGIRGAVRAEEKNVTFENKDSIAGWTVTGDVSIDPAKTREGGSGGSLKVGPGGRAVWKLGDKNLSGKVEFWVYEDGTVAAQPKAHGYGSLFGVMSKDGHALVSGSIYAGYLGGDKTYATGDFVPAKAGDLPSLKAQYLGIARKVGWHKWTFDLDAEKGLTILVDGKDVNKPAARFDWDKTALTGIAAIVFIGDGTKDGKQNLWINGVTVAQGPEMKAQPTPPPPPPPFLPATDPKPDGDAVKVLPAMANQHPRLLMTAADLPRIKAFYESPEGKLYREQMEGYLDKCTVPANRKMTPGWGQEYGLFRLPMVAMHYKLTGDKASFGKSVAYLKWLAGTADWTDGGEPAVEDKPEAYAKVLEKLKGMGPKDERNSDTTAAFTMVGAALTWDWLYNDLDPTFREQFREVLWQHARIMYYGGHKAGNPGGNYWRGVPAYNHRWFRDWGMTLATLAAAEGKPEEQWFLGELEKELKYMADWLPVDGSQHEGPGYGSSAGALGMAFQASDDCIGTKYLETPFFKTAAEYTLQVSAPGMTYAIFFADNFTNARSFHPYFMKTAARHKQADVMDGIRRAIRINSTSFGVADYAWLSLLSDDPTIKGGDYKRLATNAFLPDLGISIMRENWEDQAVAAMFKCGPMGGYKANSWRQTAKDAKGTLPYVNVAHDHPDANSFVILAGGEYLAETNRYPLEPGKLSAAHNTILINGIGQAVQGRAEGDAWQQPGSGDMTEMGKITAYKVAGNVVVTEGEAAGSYLRYVDAKTKKSRPALERFRRTFIWVQKDYVLVLDDIRAPEEVEINWLVQGAKLDPVKEAEGRYRLGKNKVQCDFQLVADAAFSAKIGVSPANDHSKLLNWQQLQATAKGKAVRFASVYDPWHRNDGDQNYSNPLTVKLAADGPDKATVTVTGTGGISDTWTWEAAKGKFEASTIRGVRKGGGLDVTVDAKAVPPAP